MADLSTITVSDYIATALPEQLASQSGGLEDATYAIQYLVDGTAYAVSYSAGRGEVVNGTVENPLLTVTLDEPTWRGVITEETASADALVSPAKMSTSRMEKLQNLKGKFNLELTKADGSVAYSTTTFNGVDTPEVTLMMKAEDYAKILKGELNSQMAFMTGKLKFKGDMNFLMKLGTLM